jgi:hypothetical protein
VQVSVLVSISFEFEGKTTPTLETAAVKFQVQITPWDVENSISFVVSSARDKQVSTLQP